MKIKKGAQGASIRGFKPEMVLGLMIIKDVLNVYDRELIITEGTGGVHSRNSLHYVGFAVDIRNRHMGKQQDSIVASLRDALGDEFDVVVEKTHIHIEYQPKHSLCK